MSVSKLNHPPSFLTLNFSIMTWAFLSPPNTASLRKIFCPALSPFFTSFGFAILEFKVGFLEMRSAECIHPRCCPLADDQNLQWWLKSPVRGKTLWKDLDLEIPEAALLLQVVDQGEPSTIGKWQCSKCREDNHFSSKLCGRCRQVAPSFVLNHLASSKGPAMVNLSLHKETSLLEMMR